eukprot:GHVO01016241.1.p1 GENE.GHVO01016241.1~~GHVO01016241.1.p1  ORF type:complete len:159 (+),score=12.29 GHVO01016241.1:255-731(+)
MHSDGLASIDLPLYPTVLHRTNMDSKLSKSQRYVSSIAKKRQDREFAQDKLVNSLKNDKNSKMYANFEQKQKVPEGTTKSLANMSSISLGDEFQQSGGNCLIEKKHSARRHVYKQNSDGVMACMNQEQNTGFVPSITGSRRRILANTNATTFNWAQDE